MATEPKTITVRPGSELYALLEQADDTPLLLERAGVRYRLDRAGAEATPPRAGTPGAAASAEDVVLRTAGIFRTAAPPLSAEGLREAAERAIAEDAIERMGGR